ncbi:MAG: HAD family hydrolase [Candidatus Bathyarchaeota archaeon]|nr:HAD family hydrolase [Candidatus Bathyarchaeota archaeon]
MIAAEAVVFDLDGTLIRSKIDFEAMRRRVVEVLVASGAPAGDLDQSRRVWEIVMGGESKLKEMGLPSETRCLIMRRITEALNAVELEAVDSVEPTAHALEALEALRGRGLRIGVATRSCNAYATQSLELTDLAGYVDVLLARDDVEHPKPDARHLLQVVEALGPSPGSVVFVGDTTTDLKTAEEAGIAFIGFLRDDDWGRRLREAGCGLIIDDLRKIADLVERRPSPAGAPG